MSGAKQMLRNAIDLLTEEEALQALEFVQMLRHQTGASLTLRRLVTDLAFTVPSGGSVEFSAVDPPLPPAPGEPGDAG